MDRINRILGENQEIESLLNACVEEVRRIFEADRCILTYPCDPDFKEPQFPFFAQSGDPAIPSFESAFLPVPPEFRDMIRALLSQEGPLAMDTADLADAGPRYREYLDRMRVRARMTIAIRTKTGKPWNLTLNQCLRDRAWTSMEKRLFKDIASRIKSSLELLLLAKELKKSEAFHHLLTEAMPQIVFTADGEGRLNWVNQRWEEFTGMTCEQSVGILLMSLVHPEDQEMIRERRERAMAQGSAFEAEMRFRGADGAFRWHLARAYPFTDAESGRPRWIGTCTDISGMKSAQEELCRSRDQVETILASTTDSIIVFGPDGRMIYANDAAGKLFGHPSGEAFLEFWVTGIDAGNLPDYRFTDEQGRAVPLDELPVRRVKRGMDVAPTLLRFLQPGTGKFRWVIAQAKPVRDGEGRAVMFISVLQDITELREQQESLRRLQKMESLGKLAGGIAHDFNNLLVAINGYSEMGMKLAVGQPMLEEFLQEILKSGQRAASLTQQLLAYGRKQMVQPKPLQINDIVLDMEKMLVRLIGEDVRLVARLDPAVPLIEADQSQLEQVVMNLALNARDAMPKGGLLTLETAAMELDDAYVASHPDAKPGKNAVIIVSDTGSGMEPEVLERAFEPFFTTKEMGKGTGLGLASVYGIVNQWGGHIAVDSELGKGSTFRVLVPESRGKGGADRNADVTMARGGRPGGTILLVEDEESVLTYTRMILERGGYRVRVAKDGPEAVEVARNHPGRLHLLLTDVVMPNMRGTDLVEKVRSLHPETKVLLMSGYLDSTVVPPERSGGDMGFIRKPFRMEELLGEVERILNAAVVPSA
jgi:PAS domain S-box-containing protein